MANKILLRRNSTAAAQPTAAQIVPGELAINTADGRLFTELNNGTIVNLPVKSIEGQAITPASLQTSGTADGIRLQAGGNANARYLSLTPNALGGNRTIYLPDASCDLAATYNGNTISANYGITANQKIGTLRNNLGDPTAEEMALFHGQYTNKFRFIPPTLQEESIDGTTWIASARMDVNALGDLMIGEGQGTQVNVIPVAPVGTYGGYRLTWDVVGQTGYVFLNFLYIYSCACGNNIAVKVERYNPLNDAWSDVHAGTISNYPGHTSIKHSTIAYHPSTTAATTYNKVRITFESTHNASTNGFTLNAIEWFGGYPGGQRRNVEFYDRDKNVTFPATLRVIGTGSDSACALSRYGVPSAGINFVSSTAVDLVAGGAKRMRVSSTGIGIGLGTNTPESALQVRGASNLGNTNCLQLENSSGVSIGTVANDGVAYFSSRLGVGLACRSNLVADFNGSVGLPWADTSFIGIQYINNDQYRLGLTCNTAYRETRIIAKAADSNGKVCFYAGAGTTEHARVHSNGCFGIGVTAPTARLTVLGFGTGKMEAGQSAHGGNWTSLSLNGSGNSAGGYNFLGSPTDNTLYINRPTGGPIGFRENNVSQVTIASGGNVGIGTTSPANSLHVVGAANTSTGHGVIVVANASTNATRVTHIGLPNDASPFLAALNGTMTAATFGWGFFDSISNGNLEIKRRGGSTTWVDALAINRVNGSVGIGTASPQAGFLLDVNGSSVIRGSVQASGDIIEFANSRYKLNSGAGSAAHSYVSVGNGNFGINNTAPGSRLEVTHTVTSNTSHAIAQFGAAGTGNWATSAHQVVIGGPSIAGYTGLVIYSDTTSGEGSLQFADGRGASDSWRGYVNYNHADNSLRFGTDATEKVRVLSSGNVGINNTAPDAKLTVTGSGATSLTKSLIVENSAGTDILTVRDDGRVGIGTASPAEALEVNGNIKCTGGIAAATAAQVGTTGSTRIYISGGGGSNAISEYYLAEANPRWVIGRDLISGVSGGCGIGFNSGGANTLATNGAAVGRPANRSLGLYTSNGTSLTERVRIDTVGNVGIGTASPAEALEVNGSIKIANCTTRISRADGNSVKFAAHSSALGHYGIFIDNTATTNGRMFRLASWADGTTGSFVIRDDTAGVDRFIINSSGVASISSGTLQLYDNSVSSWKSITANANDLNFNAVHGIFAYSIGLRGSRGSAVGLESNAANGYLAIAAGGGEKIRVSTDGNVGIGTTAPTARLTVLGNGTGKMEVGTTGHGSNYTGICLNNSANSTSDYNLLSSPTDRRLYINRPAGLGMHFRENNADQVLIASGGNVGINNTAPDARLTVKGSGASSLTKSLIVENSSGTDILTVRNDGRVGIMQASPEYPLDVTGDVRITGTLTAASIDGGGASSF